MADRVWTVEYYGCELRLTRAEYVALKMAALDDPVEAQRLADQHLSRVKQPA